MSLTADYADALGITREEAENELSLAVAAEQPAAGEVCPHCRWPTWEHQAGEITKDGCPYA